MQQSVAIQTFTTLGAFDFDLYNALCKADALTRCSVLLIFTFFTQCLVLLILTFTTLGAKLMLLSDLLSS